MELYKTLISEIELIISNYDDILNEKQGYLNKYSGLISAVIARILDNSLVKKTDWESEHQWIDDCLITKIDYQKHCIKIGGIMIWGTTEGTNQWTDPFYLEVMNFKNLSDTALIFLFADSEMESLPYETFSRNREIWNMPYMFDDWNIKLRQWKYKIEIANLSMSIN